MTTFKIRYFALALLGLSSCLQTAWSQQHQIDWSNPVFTEEYVPGELLVGFKKSATRSGRERAHKALGSEVSRRFQIVPVERVRLRKSSAMVDAARRYLKDPNVAYVEPNYIVRAMPTTPNDVAYSNLWGMTRIEAPAMWDLTVGSTSIVVGVIDTGINLGHEDLAANIASGSYDFYNDTGVMVDNDGHGTHVAGTIGAVGNNAIGVAGVNWNVGLVALKFLDPFGSTADAIDAIEYAATNTALGIKITNNSWGGGGYSKALEDAIRMAGDVYGQLFIAAAGNDGTNNDLIPQYPANYGLSNVISVAALDEDGSLANFSCFGANTVHIAAPGVNIYSTYSEGNGDNRYTALRGTSMASPHVAGAAALLWSLNPTWHYSVVRDAILNSAVPNPALQGKLITGGELNLRAALAELKPSIETDRKAYRSDATVVVTLKDPEVVSAPSREIEVKTLDTDAVVRWAATNSLSPTAPGTYNGIFSLTTGVTSFHADILNLSYTNEFTNSATVSLSIDDVPPVISDVQVEKVTFDEAIITWITDEPADTRIIVSSEIPPGGLDTLPFQGGGEYVEQPFITESATQYIHRITATGLTPSTRYFFAAISEDYAGNSASLPADLTSTNAAAYQAFSTPIQRLVLNESFEDGAFRWSVTNLNGQTCWEYGVPRYGPASAYSGERLWGTVLDNNYPHLANASLTGPAVKVDEIPRLQFMSWHRFAANDFGVVEVNDGTGWRNVTSQSGTYSNKIEGSSGDWELVTIDMPEISNKTIRVRFRLESDATLSAAGWFIDDVKIAHAPSPGLRIVDYIIDDSSGGDGDRLPEPGESFNLTLSVINTLGDVALSNVTANFTINDQFVSLNPSNAMVSYGDIGLGDQADSAPAALVTIDSMIPEGSTFTVNHRGASTSYSGLLEDTLTITVATRESISGSVTQLVGGAAIQGAIITGTANGYPAVSAFSTSDGSYILHGLVPGVSYRIVAGLPGVWSPSNPINVTGPQAGVNFGLGLATITPSPDVIDVVLDEGQVFEQLIALDNATGDIAAQYTAVAIDLVEGGTASYIDIVPLAGTIGPGTNESLTVAISSIDLAPGEYFAAIVLSGNDVSGDDVIVPVFLEVLASPVLSVERVDILGGDGDGFAEPGETNNLSIVLSNRGSLPAVALTGTISTISFNASVISDSADWPVVDVGSRSAPTNLPGLALNTGTVDGEIIPVNLVVTDIDGRITSLDFVVTASVRYAISGTITDSGTSLPVEGVLVEAERLSDGKIFKGTSDTAGVYQVYGLTPDDYRVSALPAPPYGYPAAVITTISSGNEVVDFALGTLNLSVNPSALNITVYEGQESNTSFQVTNSSAVAGQFAIEVQLVQGVSEDEIGEFDRPLIDWDALSEGDYVPGQLLVRFEEGVTMAQQLNALYAVGLSPIRSFNLVPGAIVQLTSGMDMKQVALRLEDDPAVRYAEPNYLYHLNERPNDPDLDDMYPLENLRQTGGTLGADMRGLPAWSITRGSTSVVVAVIDSGVKLNHEDLASNLVSGFDYGGNDPDPNPDPLLLGTEHGTHVAGTIGAVGNNQTGIAGVAYETRIMPLKASIGFSGVVGLPGDAIIGALEHAVLNGVKISNNSYGGVLFSGLFYEAIRTAMNSNHLFIAAAGNEALDTDAYPAYPASYNLPNIISVAATDHDDQLASFSNYGDQSVDIAAPGVDILSTYFDDIGDSYEKISGTSMAAPHVAGVAALLKSIAPDATYDMLKDAIILGARKDPLLAGVVSSGGHLDAVRALELLTAGWLEVGIAKTNLAASASVTVPLTVNSGGRLLTGSYIANIIIRGGSSVITLPVNLTVLPAAAPVLVEVIVDDKAGGDGDGYPEPGETLALGIRILNDGSALYLNPTGTLAAVNTNVTIGTSTRVWPSLPSGEQGVNILPFTVTMPSTPGDYDFNLTLPRANLNPAVLSFTLSSQLASSITGIVTDAVSSGGLSNVTVEYWGASGGGVLTDTNGSFLISGLTPGDYQLRAIGINHEKSSEFPVTLAGEATNVNIALNRPVIALNITQLLFRVQRNGVFESTLIITNSAGGDYRYNITPQPHKRIGLISDRHELNGLAPALREAGWQVSVYSNNWVTRTIPGYGIEYYGDHFEDGAAVMPNDLVILDLAGNAGGGRLLTAQERSILAEYLDRGGSVIFSGRNNLSMPDDRLLSELVGSTSIDRSTNSVDSAALQVILPAAVTNLVDVKPGDVLAAAELLYDLATPAAGTSEVYFAAGDASKLLRRETEQGGAVYLWSGNRAGDDWAQRGAWRDVLFGLIEDEMGPAPDWLSLSGILDGNLAAGSLSITARVDAAGLNLGVYPALVNLKGNYPGADTLTVPVTLEVVQSVIEVSSTNGLRNWLNQALPGNGSDSSAMFQLIFAGADGMPQPPALNGGTTGDDEVLLTFPLAASAGRFGAGFEATPDLGTFRQTFSHNMSSSDAARDIYVRAWDGSTIANSVAYGDSSLYTLMVVNGESHDFGSWVVNKAPGYPGPDAKDSNGDSIPDGWYIENGLDPRRPIGPLEAGWSLVQKAGSQGSASNQFHFPQQLFLTDNFVFVLERQNHRISVWNRATLQPVRTYGSYGTSAGQFSTPYGMGKAPDENRFAVADTPNNRIQVFTFDPSSGAITFERQFGSHGSGDGKLIYPSDVAIGPLGRIYVADTRNHRIQIFDANGTFLSKFGTLGSGNSQFNLPQGITLDDNGIIYVSDTENHRIQGFTGGGVFLWKTGSEGRGVGQFSKPSGIQLGIGGRTFIADTANHRIQVLSSTRQHIASIGSEGTGDGQVKFPGDVAPTLDSADVYVVDTWNHRLLRMTTVMDDDGDGMEDTWEILNGLNPGDPSDALIDSDGDGILNTGEFTLNTDPLNADSDGDGYPDGDEIDAGTDPDDAAGKPLYPVIKSFVRAPSLQMTWLATSGMVYELQSTTNLIPETSWTKLPGTLFTNHNELEAAFVTNAYNFDALRHFRPVLVLPED